MEETYQGQCLGGPFREWDASLLPQMAGPTVEFPHQSDVFASLTHLTAPAVGSNPEKNR